MSLLVTDPTGVWEMSETHAASKSVPSAFAWPCLPCAAPGLIAFCCAQTRECVCLRRRDYEPVSRMPAAPGVSAMTFSPCGRYLYQLSAEADCVHTRSVATGELLFAAPAGVFPRTMHLEASGRYLLVAGGAIGEACVLQTPELICERVIHTRHACFAADEWQGGLVLVCAAEGEDIHTTVYTLSPRAVRPRKLTELPGQPGGLCVCPDGLHALLSTPDGLMKLDLRSGDLLWNRPEWPLCMRISCKDNTALISDTLDGRVCLMSHLHPWERTIAFSGTAAQACFL